MTQVPPHIVRRDFAILCVTCAIWSAAFFLLKDLRETFSDTGVTMLRFSSVAVGLWALRLVPAYRNRLPSALPRSWRERLYALALGFVGTGIAYVLYYRALATTHGVEATILSSSSPLLFALLGWLLLRERLTPLQWLGVLIGFSGMYAVTTHGWGAFDVHALSAPGNLLVIVALFLETMATVLAKPLCMRSSGLGVVTLTMTGTALFGLTAAIATQTPVVLGPVTAPALLKLGYLVLLCGLLLFPTWYWIMERLPVGLMGVSLFVQSPTAAIIGYVFYGEVLEPVVWQGTALILAAIFISTRKMAPQPEPAAMPVPPGAD